MSTAAVDVDRYAPRFVIEINNQRLSAEASHMIESVEVTQELNKTNAFRLQLQDEYLGDGFRWLGHGQRPSQELIKYGNNVSVLFGYSQRLTKLLDGKIQTIGADFSEKLAPMLTLEGADEAHIALTKPGKARTFKNMTDSAIVREIAKDVGIEAKVAPTREVAAKKTKRGGKSYLEFLQTLARNNSYEFKLAGRTLSFAPPDKKAPAEVHLTWGRELISFNPTINTDVALTEVRVSAWDRVERRQIEEVARPGDETRQEPGRQLASEIAREIYGDAVKVLVDRPVRSRAEARRIAQAELDTASDSFIKAQAETVGLPELVPGTCVSVEGLGAWFSGKYYLDKVVHRIAGDGYRSTLTLRRNAL